jgi:3-oxoacyl-[acyl-carrier protein] reductase
MAKAKSGRIVNISSVVGEMGNAGQANYCASKAGIIGFTKSVAREYAKRNITVNAVAPGFIETDMTGVLTDGVRDELLKEIPLNRFGSPEDIANAVYYLVSDLGSYVTGQVLSVNGGMHM